MAAFPRWAASGLTLRTSRATVHRSKDWSGAAAMLVDPAPDLNPSNSDASQQLA